MMFVCILFMCIDLPVDVAGGRVVGVSSDLLCSDLVGSSLTMYISALEHIVHLCISIKHDNSIEITVCNVYGHVYICMYCFNV